jgi:hypothetical protein
MAASVASWHIDAMMSVPKSITPACGGQLVFIISHSVRARGRTYSIKIVAEPDPRKAEDIVRGETIPDETVLAVGPVPSGCLEAFHLKPGRYTAWRDRA